MPWIIFFVYSWIIFFIFLDKARFKHTVYGGLIAVALGSLVDLAGHKLGLYHFDSEPIDCLIASVLYAAGPLFTMGVLFFQYISPDRRTQAANVVAFSLAYLAVETLIVNSGGARYVHWHFLASLVVDLLAFTALSYVGEMIMYKRSRIRD